MFAIKSLSRIYIVLNCIFIYMCYFCLADTVIDIFECLSDGVISGNLISFLRLFYPLT